MRVGVLFSGGKDSTYACWKAMQTDEVVCLITLCSENDESYMFHTPNINLTSLQAEAAELPLVQKLTKGVEEEELNDLEEAVRMARDRFGISGVVTGAILSVYQAARIQRICNRLDLWCFNPLWYTDQSEYLKDLVGSGFHVLIAGVFSEPFTENWLGREIDDRMITELQTIAERFHVTLTGEGGELETCVIDAPFFTWRIRIRNSKTRYQNYRGTYRITDAVLVKK